MALHAAQPVRQLRRVLRRGVDAVHQRVFKDHAAARLFDIVAARVQRLVHRIGVGHGHEPLSHLVVWRMQGERERHRQILLREAAHVRHQPAGGERHAAHADAQPALHAQDAQEAHDVVVVVHRLAAAHQHDVADLLPLRRKHAVRTDDLPQNLARAQAARAAVERGGAERAAHAAAHLRGHAERVAVLVAHEHALDDVPVVQAIEQLDCAVELRGDRLEHLHRVVKAVFRQRLAQRLGQIAHPLKRHALMQPREHLLRAEGRLPHVLQIDAQLLGRHAQQLRLHHALTLRMRQTKKPSVPSRCASICRPSAVSCAASASGSSAPIGKTSYSG